MSSLSILPANPRLNYLTHKDSINEAIQRVLESGAYILGKEVRAFEEEFAAYLGTRSAIGVGSGTDALHLALRAAGIGDGDAVITPSHTAVATVAAIELTGAIPVFVDIDPRTFTLDPNLVADVLKQNHAGPSSQWVRAIIPVHLYGHPADMVPILEAAKRYEVCVIEDCAQSTGAAIQNRKTGSWGDIAAFSFYPTKNLGALGDGGAVVTNNPMFASKARELREYGWRQKYISESKGMNTRLDELQAGVLRAKLQHLDQENQRRQQLAEVYATKLSEIDLTLPTTVGPVTHVYHQYVIRSPKRDELRNFLENRGIGTLIHYPLPVHEQPAYRANRAAIVNGLPNSERVCREIVSLPIYPELSEAEVAYVAEAISIWTHLSIR